MNKITGKISTTPIIKGSAKTINEYTGNGVIPGVYIKEEKDPTVPDYVKNITEEDINKWNNPEVDNDYNNATNKPSINGVPLEGNKTTEDLGIEIPNESEIFDISCTISLATMTVTNVSNFSKDIIAKRNEGYLIRMNCSFVENPKMNVVVILNVIDGKWTFFYPVIRGDIGQGMTNYIFRLGVGEENATIEAHDLSGGSALAINLIHTFDIEEERTEEDVFSAIAILELMEIFGFEIYQLQEFIADHENRISALEN